MPLVGNQVRFVRKQQKKQTPLHSEDLIVVAIHDTLCLGALWGPLMKLSAAFSVPHLRVTVSERLVKSTLKLLAPLEFHWRTGETFFACLPCDRPDPLNPT